MKAQWILFIAVCLLVSCSEEAPEANPTLVGTWKWYSTCGGIAGTCGYAPSNTDVIITFTETEIIQNDKPAVAYTVVNKVVEPSTTQYEILSDHKTSFFTVHENTLTTDSNTFVVSYHRIK
jgi:hypothetical protein